MQKTARKNTKYLRNETNLSIGHLANAIAHAKAIAFAKWSVWVKNYKYQKHVKNHSTRILELFCAKTCSKKHQILEKWDKFENRPSCKGYSPCKGYSLCKMVSLGQKLKMPKTWKKNHSTRILKLFCPKNRSKKHQIFEKWHKFENRPFCKVYSLCKLVSLSQKWKMPKTCKTPFYKNIRVVLCKNVLEKTPNIREMSQVCKSAILQRL
mgnify:CR=1 FL=1